MSHAGGGLLHIARLREHGLSFWAAYFKVCGHVWPLEYERKMVRDALADADLDTEKPPVQSFQVSEPVSVKDQEPWHECSYAEISEAIGVSRERVRQIELSALRKLHAALHGEAMECLRERKSDGYKLTRREMELLQCTKTHVQYASRDLIHMNEL